MSESATHREVTTPAAPDWLASKITTRHTDRLAIVYIRQSTLQQVQRNRESTEIQYNLRSMARSLGWSDDRILVIDQDLGRSGASVEGREGFQRLVAEVSLDHVGLVLGVEMSRLARSCKDWYQLLELCSLYGTLLADQDGVYDPAQYSDRLVLGLKGTMSEAELHILRQRMNQGRLNKARRGELHSHAPLGYVRRPSGEMMMDPDVEVQEVVRLVFQKFVELGTLNAVLRFLVKHGIRLGIHVHEGPNRGDLEWRRPCRQTIGNMLHNPAYAGAYVYARRPTDRRRKIPGRPGTGRTAPSPEEWQICLRDRLPAYITWEQYLENLSVLRTNRNTASTLGVAKDGTALLAGLLVCGRCGQRMTIMYSTRGGNSRAQYRCDRLAVEYGEPRCQSLSTVRLDEYVAAQVLQALSPASIELAIQAATLMETEREQLNSLWQKRLERSSFEAERAARQYHAVEPENRLVARHLEGEWESKMRAHQKLNEEYDRFCSAQPRVLSAQERGLIQRLAHDIPALWKAPATAQAERKTILRQLIERVVVETIGKSERVKVVIHWIGGSQTHAEITRPVAKWEQMSTFADLADRLAQLVAAGKTREQIAQVLNDEGWQPPKRYVRFEVQGVRQLMQRLGLRHRSYGKITVCPDRRPDEWTIKELAAALSMPEITLHSWLGRGEVQARKSEKTGRWLIWADDQEIERLRKRRAMPAGFRTREKWLERQPGREGYHAPQA